MIYSHLYFFFCHTICKHLGSPNVHIYWIYIQYGLKIGLMMAWRAETFCQIYRLIIKLFVVFRVNITIFIWYLYWITQRVGPSQNVVLQRSIASSRASCPQIAILSFPLSISSTLSFPWDHSVASYAFFFVSPSLPSIPLFFLQITRFTRQFLHKKWPMQVAFLRFTTYTILLSLILLIRLHFSHEWSN